LRYHDIVVEFFVFGRTAINEFGRFALWTVVVHTTSYRLIIDH